MERKKDEGDDSDTHHGTHNEKPGSPSIHSTQHPQSLSQHPPNSGQGSSAIQIQLSELSLHASDSMLHGVNTPAHVKKHRRTIIESLDFPQTISRQITIKREHAEACRWFLETPQCRYWLDTKKLGNHTGSHNGILWIKGKPGSGKTTLMKFMLSHTRQSIKGDTIISFFFNLWGGELQKSTAGLYRSLLLQLFQERPDLQRVLDATRAELPWGVGTLQSLFRAAIQGFGRASLICFIDALDECEESQIREMLGFLADTCELAASSETKLRICLASRRVYPLLEIPRGLEFILEAYGNAIVDYLEKNLKIGHEEITEMISFEVQKRASGNFRWATLVANWLNQEYAKGCNLHSLYIALCQFSTDYGKLSETINDYNGQQSPPILVNGENPPKRPVRVRTSKPKVKTGCNNCKQRRILCDGKRPECTQCARSRKVCTGYPPPPRAATYEEIRTVLGPPVSSAVTDTSHHDINRHTEFEPLPLPSDSGYGTASYGSQAKLDQSGLERDREDDDNRTVYTEVAGYSDTWTESYVDTFATDLFTKIGGKQLSAQMIETLSDSLPTLLKALALNIGYQNRTQVQRDMMVFIHKQRQAITKSFKGHHDHANDLESETTAIPEPKPPEIMNRWLTSTDESRFERFDTEPPEDNPGSVAPGERPEESEVMIPELEEYRKTLIEDPSYVWMLARLRRDLVLSKVQYDILNRIMGTIQQTFPQTNDVSRKRSPEEVQVTFTVTWDIMGFLRQQCYGIDHYKAIANAVTITGTHAHAQALTCRQYMAQMWPLTGSQTLKLIQETLKTTEHKKKLFFSTPCRLTLEALIVDGSSVVVTASGLPYFIAEVGEQLAWMGSALRPSLPNTGICICTPYPGLGTLVSRDPPRKVKFFIEYHIESPQLDTHNSNGQCWSHLFLNPVIAGGFPILRRQELDTGLEMSLELMVALAGTRYLNTFNSNTFIKGFNTMLVLAKQSADSMVWHLLHSQDPSKRISYLSSDLEATDITKTALEKSRHVLGWCADATSIVGTTTATYDIGRSRLPKAHSHHMLEKVEISAGQFVTGTAAFTLGNREKPVHISRFGFLDKLQWISSKHMVLWDEGDKRGWLVNGASALLHLLRASLEHSKRKFQSAWLLDSSALKDPADPSRPDASLQFLTCENNRNVKLYMDRTEVYEENVGEGAITTSTSRRQTRHYRLEDRIEHIYNILEKLVDHQTDVERRSGLQIKIRPRKQLEGWDFKDLVKDGDPIFPRVTTLPTIGKGWVDFTRAIHAVTLFGTGFGDLIQPRQTSDSMCSRWSLLPKDSYYLATCVSNLLEIMEEDGDAGSNPRRLCDSIIWHMKQATFDPCPCTNDAKRSHHDPVQVLFPSKFTVSKKPQVDLKGSGAVIFGQNMRVHWHWPDMGDPVKGDPPLEAWLATDWFEDSGIGSSLGSSRLLLASDPSSAGSQSQGPGSQSDNSPSESQLTLPSSPPERPAPKSKRALKEIISSASKKLRR